MDAAKRQRAFAGLHGFVAFSELTLTAEDSIMRRHLKLMNIHTTRSFHYKPCSLVSTSFNHCLWALTLPLYVPATFVFLNNAKK
jgi:hypothetical protein